MSQLRNRNTGVLITVDDDLAERLGSEWEAVQAPARARPADDDDQDAYTNWDESDRSL